MYRIWLLSKYLLFKIYYS